MGDRSGFDVLFCRLLNSWSSSIRLQRYFPVSIFIILLLNILTLSQAVDSKPQCSDISLARYFNCSSSNCVYGEESLVNCSLAFNMDKPCEVN